jgi:multidrug efflux system membrane fusion protein
MKAIAAKTKSRPVRRLLWIAGIAVVVLVGGFASWRRIEQPSHTAAQPPAVPVAMASVARRDVPILLQGLGTVAASNTVAIHSQVDGKLQSVNFTEGQEVHAGDTLAVVDPRTFRAALDQAVAKKAEDQAQLVAARKDLERFKTLVLKNAETQQNVDTQQAKVDQLVATIDADQGAIDSAQTQLSYATITAPIDGRVGFRQVDAGNIIHASDPNPLTVLTQIRPVVATFTLPQKNLAEVRAAMLRGPVTVSAYDQDNSQELATGQLLLIDNQIDQTTSTIRLKANFANADEVLWPGEFVHVRVAVDTQAGVLTVPPVALQRGPQGYYTWVIKSDNTVEQRPVEANQVNDEVAIVTKGLAADERVVVDGQYRLQAGSRVDAKTQQAAMTPGKPS